VAIEDVAGEVLLQIGLGIELKDHSHVRDRHPRNIRVADVGIVDADGQRDSPGRRLERLVEGLEMLAQQVRGQALLVDRGIQEGKTTEGESRAAARRC